MLPIKTKENVRTCEAHILLVDDEEIVVKLHKKMLERLGYRVTETVSSTEALKTFTRTPELFDMVISDLAMPKLNGMGLAQELLKVRPEIPIAICSGFSEDIDEENGIKLGIRCFLTKPVLKAQLGEAVQSLLDARPGSSGQE